MVVAVILALLPARTADADELELRKAARTAYDKAVQAHEQGDFAEAARQFAHADRLFPNDSVLKDALGEALRADAGVFGLMLVARAARSPNNAELQATAAKAREAFRGRAGRIEVDCPERCAVEIDGHSPEPDAERWLAVGPHVVVLTTSAYANHHDEHRIEVLPLETTRVQFVPPPPLAVVASSPSPSPLRAPAPAPAPAAPRAEGGISPAWFWLGAGLTVALGGATTLSALDVSSRRRDFADRGCSRVGSDACDADASDGRGAVTRTNVLLGATALLGAATVATLFFVRWKPTLTTTVGAGDSGMRVALTGRF